MSQISYYGADPSEARPERGGLIASGIILIMLGALGVLASVFSIAAAVFLSRITIPSAHLNRPAHSKMYTGIAVYLLAGASLIWIGVGSLLGRRWVRPVVIVSAVPALFFGLLIFLGTLSVFFTRTPTIAGVSSIFFGRGIALVLFPMFVAFIVVPAALLWFYSKSSTRLALESLDPQRRWTDRCSLGILGWSAGSFFVGVSTLISVQTGFATFFNRILVGWPAALEAVVVGGLLIWGAWLCYNNKLAGWRLTFALLLLLTASSTVFAVFGNSSEFNQMIAGRFGQNVQTTIPKFYLTSARINAVLTYTVAIIYGIFIRKSFAPAAQSLDVEAVTGG